ncbi:hypothetical protein [Bacillus sp. Cr_A10]|uniref:hypothetical protein n=1 Tax=Bacillus sp. Cr_A10 TaxID=3033993 RepID=UPI0023DA6035|nr:hypothetical protein [Bacillus sp. Cr_A10]MDF2068005.1 hypothetical protein [Bacillus sp. Cr_A10]
MDINTIAAIVGIIAGIFTIFQVIKEFIKPNLDTKVEQNNSKGNNIYIDKSTKINKTMTETNITKYYPKSNDSGDEGIVITLILSIIISVISLAFYSQTYKLIPMISLLLLAFDIYRDKKIPFQNTKTKVQWAFQKLLVFIVIIILFFTPKSILNIINQIPEFRADTFNDFFDWLTYSFNIIKDLIQGSSIMLISLFLRIGVSFGLIFLLFEWIRSKKNTHKTQNNKELVGFFVYILLLICILNFEFIWNLIEPLRTSFENWFITD